MPVYETFAKPKQEVANTGKPVMYRDDILPGPFRVQVLHIWRNTIGYNDGWFAAGLMDFSAPWAKMHETLATEMGLLTLWQRGGSHRECCEQFLLHHDDVDDVLSLIEISFRLVQGILREHQRRIGYQTRWQPADDAIAELNHRFREHGIGYQYQGGQIIAVNSQYLHSEVVEPAISLLHEANFEGPLQEFMAAHEHYRKGNYKEAIANAGSAFESTMKAICEERSWTFGRTTASALIETLFSNALVPPEMKNHFDSLLSAMKSGVPTLRNQAGRGAHGQGSVPVEVPDYLAAYCLHLTAANIVFLVEAHNAKHEVTVSHLYGGKA